VGQSLRGFESLPPHFPQSSMCLTILFKQKEAKKEMASDDIYKSKAKYERYKTQFDNFCTKTKAQRYFVKNKANIEYFYRLCDHFEARESYVRRVRVLQKLRLICFATEKHLKECDRDEINKIVAFMHTRCKTIHSKRDFINDMKFLWKLLLPEIDERGRIDETLVPYPVRHLSNRIDRSQQKRRKDKLSWEEYQSILNYFGDDPRMQALISVKFESLGRPQEILYRRIEEVEIFDNYAKIHISDHGKEGIGTLVCIDSFPYLMNWLNVHKKDAFLFVNTKWKKGSQMTPVMVNKLLKKACKSLGINKPITCYSFKRNGVTFRRIMGDSDLEIQHAARWTSTKQLKTYDLSVQDDVLDGQLAKRGLVKSKKFENRNIPKRCIFCNKVNVATNVSCENCKRPLDRKKIEEQMKADENQVKNLRSEIETLRNEINSYKSKQFKTEDFMQHPEVRSLFNMVENVKKELAEIKGN